MQNKTNNNNDAEQSVSAKDLYPNFDSTKYKSDKRVYLCDVVITPEEAKAILAWRNEVNRRKNPNRIVMYSDAMKAKMWRDDVGTHISFTKSGKLANGQHCLEACATSGTPLTIDILLGLAEDAIRFADRNYPRTVSDNYVFATGNEPTDDTFSYAKRGFGVAKWIAVAEGHKKDQIGDDLLVTVYETNKGVIDIVLDTPFPKSGRRPGFRGCVASAYNTDPQKVKTFLAEVTGDGSGLLSGSPSLVLREYLKETSEGGDAPQRDYYITLFCLNALFAGRNITRLPYGGVKAKVCKLRKKIKREF
jgi:hypothetical protein